MSQAVGRGDQAYVLDSIIGTPPEGLDQGNPLLCSNQATVQWNGLSQRVPGYIKPGCSSAC